MIKRVVLAIVLLATVALIIQILLPTIVGALKIAINILAIVAVAAAGYYVYKRLKR
ncbi:MAG: hypothetical protein RMM53_01605 [Bacteroidia bacterium]|nr:hypothetical protein [Bacteroidia bacterium]MDW8332888.1 hypothetical protein [Bacteroidia bacterium]